MADDGTIVDLQVGAYTLVGRLGAGSMGAVYRARPAWGQAQVAIKLLTGSALGAAARRSFEREVRAIAALDHPHVVTLLDTGVVTDEEARADPEQLTAGDPWLATELASGDLRQWVQRLRWERLREVLTQILDGLSHAHARGILHGDIKPANLLVRHQDVLLADFGLATLQRQAEGSRVSGTPSYMAPELIQRDVQRTGPWTDLYAVGCVAWTLLTGTPPLERDSIRLTLEAQVVEPVPELPYALRVPPELASWLDRLLAKSPALRFQTAADARLALLELPTVQHDEAPVVVPRRSEAPPTWGMSMVPVPRLDEAAPGAVLVPVEHPVRLGSWRKPGVWIPVPRHGAELGVVGLRTLPIVGRERQQDALWTELQAMADGGSLRSVCVVGVPGVGTSRLGGWLGERAYELGVAWPIEVVGAGSGKVRVQGSARLLGFPDEPGGPGERIWQAAAWIRRTCRPAVVLIDGLDAGSMSEVMTAWRAADALAPVAALLVVISPIVAESPAADAVIEVDALETGAAEALVRQLLELDDALVAQVVAVSGGRPQALIDVVSHWVEEGLVGPGPEGRWTVPGIATPPVPLHIARIAELRATALRDRVTEPQRVAVYLAVVLEPWDRELWADAVRARGLDPDDHTLSSVVEEAHGWPAHRHTLFGRISAQERAELHRCIVEALDASGVTGGRGVRAWHQWHAGHHAEVALELVWSARGAMRTQGPARALAMLRVVEPELDALAIPELRAWWALVNSEVAHLTGRGDEAHGWALRSLAAVPEGDVDLRIEVLTVLAVASTTTGRDALDRARELLELIESVGRAPSGAARMIEALALKRVGRLADAEAAARRGDWGAPAEGARRTLLADVVSMQGRHAEALVLSRQAVERERESGDAWRVRFRLEQLGLALVEDWQLDEGRAVLAEAWAEHERWGNAYGIRNVLYGLAKAAVLGGDLSEAEVLARQCLRLSEVLDAEPDMIRVLLADIELRGGAHRSWRDMLLSLQASGRETGETDLLLDALVSEVAAHVDPDAWGAAQDWLEQELARVGGTDPLVAMSTARAGDGLAGQGRIAEAARAYRCARDQYLRMSMPDRANEVAARLPG